MRFLANQDGQAIASEATASGPSNEKIENCSTAFPNNDDNNNVMGRFREHG